MDCSHRSFAPAKPWHALLAPLPEDVIVRRRPVGSPEVLATPEGAAIAGWEQLTIELSAGLAGLRHVLVVLDADGQPISASDTVLYRIEVSKTDQDADTSTESVLSAEFYHESIGGRFETDGTFRGTRWRTVGEDYSDGSEPKMESTPSEPSAEDIVDIKALVSEIMRRQPLL
jgi:hypothetical protein